jgi:hypothetical protein
MEPSVLTPDQTDWFWLQAYGAADEAAAALPPDMQDRMDGNTIGPAEVGTELGGATAAGE